jgi:hypothetical protein
MKEIGSRFNGTVQDHIRNIGHHAEGVWFRFEELNEVSSFGPERKAVDHKNVQPDSLTIQYQATRHQTAVLGQL